MYKRTILNIIIRSSLSLALIMAIWTPIQSQSGTTAEKKMMDDKMMKGCQEMMDQKQKMMVEMKAQDAELTAEVAKMNSAPEGKKLDLVTAIVTHMVDQRTAMNVRMEKMQQGMMKHMMEHMQMGQESMKQCPMMMGMMDMSRTSGHVHNGHMEGKK